MIAAADQAWRGLLSAPGSGKASAFLVFPRIVARLLLDFAYPPTASLKPIVPRPPACLRGWCPDGGGKYSAGRPRGLLQGPR